MKLILSRKGFDSAAGGVASPILPDGRLCSLPIPDTQSPFTYGDIQFDGRPLGPLVETLTRGKVAAGTPAHLDPDLNVASVARADGWRPLFGQSGAARGHLRNQGVGEGDLFLFYGWFRQTEVVDGKLGYVREAPDLHVLFGWLQIAHRLRVAEAEHAPVWACYHPHFQRPQTYWDDSVYVAAEQLAWPGVSHTVKGGGVFGTYRPDLQLTAPGRTRSLWQLPYWFYPFADPARASHLTYHGKPRQWAPHSDHVLLDCAKQGQEFVLDCSHYPEAMAWVAALFQ